MREAPSRSLLECLIVEGEAVRTDDPVAWMKRVISMVTRGKDRVLR